MTPSVGRKVHYVSHGTPVQADGSQAFTPACRAAVITEAGGWITLDAPRPASIPEPGEERTLRQRWDPDACTLTVFNPGGLFLNPDRPVPYHDGIDVEGVFAGYPGGTWHWPERV